MVTIQPHAQSSSRKLADRSIWACLHLFLHFAADFMTEISGDLSPAKFIYTVRQFLKKSTHSRE